MQADVVVVGGGGAGLAAAISARSRGADVVLLEKNPALGGTTAWSVGSITAAGTHQQQQAGVVDTPAEHYRDMPLFAPADVPDNDTLRRVLTENVPDSLRWLEEAGIEFFGPSEEPPHSRPRMHNVLPNSRSYVYHLERKALGLGVRILTDACVYRLVNEDGRITAVMVDRPGEPGVRINAARGVILAAGDFAASEQMKRERISEAVALTRATNPTSTGDGIRMGLEVGGAHPQRRPLFRWPALCAPAASVMGHAPAAFAVAHAPGGMGDAPHAVRAVAPLPDGIPHHGARAFDPAV